MMLLVVYRCTPPPALFQSPLTFSHTQQHPHDCKLDHLDTPTIALDGAPNPWNNVEIQELEASVENDNGVNAQVNTKSNNLENAGNSTEISTVKTGNGGAEENEEEEEEDQTSIYADSIIRNIMEGSNNAIIPRFKLVKRADETNSSTVQTPTLSFTAGTSTTPLDPTSSSTDNSGTADPGNAESSASPNFDSTSTSTQDPLSTSTGDPNNSPSFTLSSTESSDPTSSSFSSSFDTLSSSSDDGAPSIFPFTTSILSSSTSSEVSSSSPSTPESTFFFSTLPTSSSSSSTLSSSSLTSSSSTATHPSFLPSTSSSSTTTSISTPSFPSTTSSSSSSSSLLSSFISTPSSSSSSSYSSPSSSTLSSSSSATSSTLSPSSSSESSTSTTSTSSSTSSTTSPSSSSFSSSTITSASSTTSNDNKLLITVVPSTTIMNSASTVVIYHTITKSNTLANYSSGISSKNKNIAIGVSIGIGIPLISAIIIVLLLAYRRKQQNSVRNYLDSNGRDAGIAVDEGNFFTRFFRRAFIGLPILRNDPNGGDFDDDLHDDLAHDPKPIFSGKNDSDLFDSNSNSNNGFFVSRPKPLHLVNSDNNDQSQTKEHDDTLDDEDLHYLDSDDTDDYVRPPGHDSSASPPQLSQ
ncbi:unnamed protein product [Pichia kudriavzevii]